MDHNVDNGRGRHGATADPTPDRDYNGQAAQAAMMEDDTMSMMAIDRKSPGVRRIEAIISVFTKVDKTWFFGALVLMTCEWIQAPCRQSTTILVCGMVTLTSRCSHVRHLWPSFETSFRASN